MIDKLTAAEREEYVGVRAAMRLSGRSAQWVQRMGLIGQIRTLIVLGMAPRYHVADVAARAKTRPQPAGSPHKNMRTL